MPLIVKDYKWKQTESKIIIEVPLHGVSASKVDIFTSPKYLKASYSPNFFEVLLLHSIDTKASQCILTNSDIIFDLQKCENIQWDCLELDVSKNEKQALKNELIAQEHQRFQTKCEEKRTKRSSLQKIAVKEAIKLDTKQRENIDMIKKTEKDKALDDFVHWKQHPKKSQKKKSGKITNFTFKDVPQVKELPAIRSTASLEISFTPRELPTPSRESRLEEENEWLRKQAEARRSVGFVSEDLRPEEKNPMYLKAKGDEFLKQKNYLGAISAYSFGIKLSINYVDLYIGRSEAQYQQGIQLLNFLCDFFLNNMNILIGNYQRAIEDCSTALDLMKPAVDSNFKERAICIKRRGLCLAKIGLYKEAFSELEIALRMNSDDLDLKILLEELENKLD